MKFFKSIPGRYRIQPHGLGAVLGGLAVAYSLNDRSVYWAVVGIACAVMGQWAAWRVDKE